MLSAVLLTATLTLAPQQEPQKEKLSAPKPVVKTSGYVTEAEALAVFKRAEQTLRKVTKSQAKVDPIKIGTSTKPASREKLLLEFARLYDVAKPKFKLIMAPVKTNPAVLKMSNPSSKEKLLLLVKRGAVANYGPLAAGPADKLTLNEFGDAIGFFFARMAEMTHLPTKFTPAIMPGG